jgi:hypothetical protein
MNKTLLFTIIGFIYLLHACGHTKNSIPKAVSDYLTETLDLLEQKSVNKNKIDWNEFRADVLKQAQNAKSIEETYPAISYAVTKLNDNHSYFKPITASVEDSENKPLPILSDEITPDDIGYIRIPFCIGTEDENSDYISKIRTKIEKQSQRELKGWIVDLRGNFGGNMWPMLLSIEPLIGNGTVGYFFYANNKREAWRLVNGKAFINDQLILETKIYSKQDLSNQLLVVLTDNQTASSGEAIAVALKCRENTKSFGKSTFGVSTGCVSHILSDGSTINLAESSFADRKMTKYGSIIVPDFEVDEDQVLKAGIEWIYKINKN